MEALIFFKESTILVSREFVGSLLLKIIQVPQNMLKVHITSYFDTTLQLQPCESIMCLFCMLQLVWEILVSFQEHPYHYKYMHHSSYIMKTLKSGQEIMLK